MSSSGVIFCFSCFVLALAGCKTNEISAPPLTAVKIDSTKIAVGFYFRAASLYEEGIHNDSALALTDSALKYRNDDPNSWHLRGNLLGRKDDFRGALAAYDEALRLKPNYGDAWWHRGCLHASTGLQDSALADLEHAIAVDSSYKSGPFSDDCWKELRKNPKLLAMTR